MIESPKLNNKAASTRFVLCILIAGGKHKILIGLMRKMTNAEFAAFMFEFGFGGDLGTTQKTTQATRISRSARMNSETNKI